MAINPKQDFKDGPLPFRKYARDYNKIVMSEFSIKLTSAEFAVEFG